MTDDAHSPPGLLIAGDWIADTGTGTPLVNPATGARIGTAPAATPALVARALEAADAGFERWRRTPPAARAEVLRRAAAALRPALPEAAAHLVREMGKPLAEAMAEMESCVGVLEWAAEAVAGVPDRVLPARPGFADLRVRHEPVGTVLAVAPWNFPASLPTRKVAAALAVGCAVIARPAPEAPSAFGFVARALQAAGLPDGVLQIVLGEPEVAVYPLIDSPVIRKVAFTGSTRVGKLLAARAGANAKPCVMELGGHAPVIVCADADVERAVALSVASKFRNAGQVCVSPTRFFVHDSLAERFLEGFVEGARALRLGDGLDPDTQMGPLAHAGRVPAVEALVRDAEAQGGDLRLGGFAPNRPGCFHAPTVLADVPAGARIMQEEPFGPVAVINRFRDLDAAIAAANGTDFALGAYAFTGSEETAEHLAGEIDAGMVGINSYTIVFPDSPIGGRRASGFGSEGGPEGIAAYLIPKFTSRS